MFFYACNGSNVAQLFSPFCSPYIVSEANNDRKKGSIEVESRCGIYVRTDGRETETGRGSEEKRDDSLPVGRDLGSELGLIIPEFLSGPGYGRS